MTSRAQDLLLKIEEVGYRPLTRTYLRQQGYKQHPRNPEMWVHPRTGDMKAVGMPTKTTK